MKASDLIDTLLVHPDFRIVAELPNGQRIPVKRYKHDDDAKGEPIIVLEVGQKPRRSNND